MSIAKFVKRPNQGDWSFSAPRCPDTGQCTYGSWCSLHADSDAMLSSPHRVIYYPEGVETKIEHTLRAGRPKFMEPLSVWPHEKLSNILLQAADVLHANKQPTDNDLPHDLSCCNRCFRSNHGGVGRLGYRYTTKLCSGLGLLAREL